MLIGFSMPAVQAVVLSGSPAGAALLGDTQDGLYDGFPAREARLQWMTGGGQTTASALRLSLRFAGSAVQLRLAAVLGLRLPIGTRVVAELYTAHAGTLVASVDTRVVQLPGGATGAWFVWPASVGTALRFDLVIYNDVNGVASIAAGTVFEIGELIAMRAVSIDIQSDWTLDTVDPSDGDISRDSQRLLVTRTPYRRLETALSAVTFAGAYAGGLTGGLDLEQLRVALAGDRRCAAVPRWTANGTAVDLSMARVTALYGVGRLAATEHQGGDYFAAGFAVDEQPAVP
jgi:hypothetical protein